MASPIQHVGDTEEFRIGVGYERPPQLQEPQERPQRRWSAFRVWTFLLALLTSVIYIGTVVGSPGHRIVEVPDATAAMLRAACTVLIVLAVLATAYDIVAPKVWRRLAVLRINQQALEERLEERYAALDARMTDLTDALESYGCDKRQEGFEAALRDPPSVPPQRHVEGVMNGHLRSL